jgi:hypothetical protein
LRSSELLQVNCTFHGVECDGFFLAGYLRPGRGSSHGEYLLLLKTFPYVVYGWMDERIVKVWRSNDLVRRQKREKFF